MFTLEHFLFQVEVSIKAALQRRQKLLAMVARTRKVSLRNRYTALADKELKLAESFSQRVQHFRPQHAIAEGCGTPRLS